MFDGYLNREFGVLGERLSLDLMVDIDRYRYGYRDFFVFIDMYMCI